MCEQMTTCLESLVFSIQLGDDLCDWEADFKTNLYTTFIRRCFRLAGGELKLKELEDLIYCAGVYESTIAEIVADLRKIAARIQSISPPSTLLLEYINRHSTNLQIALLNALEIKSALRKWTLNSRTLILPQG